MSETTSTIIQGGALAILLAFMVVSIRYLAQELKTGPVPVANVGE
jgi:hypothetical protein